MMYEIHNEEQKYIKNAKSLRLTLLEEYVQPKQIEDEKIAIIKI